VQERSQHADEWKMPKSRMTNRDQLAALTGDDESPIRSLKDHVGRSMARTKRKEHTYSAHDANQKPMLRPI
jgi:hypothetical protein